MSAPLSGPYGRPTTVTVAGALLMVTGLLLVIGLALIGLQGTAVPMLSVGICVAAILVMFFSASKVLGRRSRGWGIGAGGLVLVLAVVILLARLRCGTPAITTTSPPRSPLRC